jgi:PhoH-like ATPase
MTDLRPSADAAAPAPRPLGTEVMADLLPTKVRLVIDTSVLIADPTCVLEFTEADIIIPLTVVEELDGLKSRSDDVGRSARTALRTLEELRIAHGGSLAQPVPTGAPGATLQIEINNIRKHLLIEHGLDPVSNDAALRIKAAHLGVSAAEHTLARRSNDRPVIGWSTIDAAAETIDTLYTAGAIAIESVSPGLEIAENEFAVLQAGSQSALVRAVGDEMVLLPRSAPDSWGLRPRNKEQRFALELLLDPEIKVVALDGRAGTGKTLLAIAAGLEQVVEQRRYERLAIYRPLVPVGRADVGFLPGGLDEKLDPWMAAIHDAVVALTDMGSSHDAGNLVAELTERGQLSLESVTFLRGRSLQRQFVLVDEAQNLEPTTLRTILTRVGEGTKVVFTGDTSQIDAPYLGESNNALSVLASAFSGQRCFGHITLTACERSDVASLAAELL